MSHPRRGARVKTPSVALTPNPLAQNCYHVGSLPEGDWLCDPCSAGCSKRSAGAVTLPECVLCRETPPDGAPAQPMLAVDPASCSGRTKQFAHMVCALTLPGVELPEPGGPRLVSWSLQANKQLDQLAKLKCVVCKGTSGAKVQCSRGAAEPLAPGPKRRKNSVGMPQQKRRAVGCCAALHPLCALRERLFLNDTEHNYVPFCVTHAPNAAASDERLPEELRRRHAALLVAATAPGLQPLVLELTDRKKQRPSLLGPPPLSCC